MQRHTLVVAAERNGRTYIAVTMRIAADLGANCTDSIALFDYAFNNFDTLTVNGKKMTVPKGVTADQLTVEQVDKKRKMLNRYFYNGQYVGYAAPAATPTPQAVQTAAVGTGENTSILRQYRKNRNFRNRKRRTDFPICQKSFLE